jgi:hypothetical protein
MPVIIFFAFGNEANWVAPPYSPVQYLLARFSRASCRGLKLASANIKAVGRRLVIEFLDRQRAPRGLRSRQSRNKVAKEQGRISPASGSALVM